MSCVYFDKKVLDCGGPTKNAATCKNVRKGVLKNRPRSASSSSELNRHFAGPPRSPPRKPTTPRPMKVLTALDRSYKASCLTIAYIAFLILPFAAIHVNVSAAAAGSAPPPECKFSWQALRCERARECTFAGEGMRRAPVARAFFHHARSQRSGHSSRALWYSSVECVRGTGECVYWLLADCTRGGLEI